MGKYPETDDRDAAGITDPDNVVVDLDRYRQWRIKAGRGTNANPLRKTEGTGARNAPVEGDHRS
jgi:hypothetical protein